MTVLTDLYYPLFQTGISTIGQATLAFGLPNLTHLERGDYLCDLLEFVDEDGDPTMTEKKLAIKEFWTSEEYFFHTEDQVSLRILSGKVKVGISFAKSFFFLSRCTKFHIIVRIFRRCFSCSTEALADFQH